MSLFGIIYLIGIPITLVVGGYLTKNDTSGDAYDDFDRSLKLLLISLAWPFILLLLMLLAVVWLLVELGRSL